MQRIFKRQLFTLIKNYHKNLTEFKVDNTFPNNNEFFKKISLTIEKLFDNNYDNMTNLHRWCIKTSPKYVNTCNWEKKLDNAGRDNCYINHH